MMETNSLTMPWPTRLTGFRLALIPLLVMAYGLEPRAHPHILAACLFVIAALTDALDGYLARKWQQETSFGAFLDPVADKLLVSTVLVLLVNRYPSLELMICAMVIIGREIMVSALREWMAEMGQCGRVNVANIAKIKTLFQMLALTVLLWVPNQEVLAYRVALVFLQGAVALTLLSLSVYIRRSWPWLRRGMLARSK